MSKTMAICVFLSVLLIAASAGATLWDRGGGLIYDDVLEVTWLQDANYAQTSGYDADGAMTWDDAMGWVAQLNQNSFHGFNYWRLTRPEPACNGFLGYGCVGSELGYMYYENLNNPTDLYNNAPTNTTFIDGTGKSLSFNNLVVWYYWNSDQAVNNRAWAFDFIGGRHFDEQTSMLYYVWPVLPGDVIPTVPVPGAVWLLGSGLACLLGYHRRRK